ncbi:MAG TPA: cellulase family glycosylhydrolase [Treponemataceae bacterium]|nr:cellulase family glycosylhydrolase [Treponemataceae bacterium]
MKLEGRYTVDGIHIRDRAGRIVILRGCNLGGDSKVPFAPAGNPLSYDVSFTGRPFPESDADAHFARLAGWGFTFIRLVVTWEAVEHAGPGIYDEDYLAYLRNVIKKGEERGLSFFIDPHQDAWSRWTGGDGAPGWTLEAVGFDLAKIAPTGAAFTVASEGNSYRPMSWTLNYLRYANATMWTLFFAGNTFAPGLLIEGVGAQEWLQDHFIQAMRHTARRLKDCAALVGFGTLNEPHYGFIGLKSLSAHHRVHAPSGAAPTAFQAIASASGFPQKIKRFALVGKVPLAGSDMLNPAGETLFRDGFRCPWLTSGVWAIRDGVPTIVCDDWFYRARGGAPIGTAGRGRAYDFCADFLKPFQKRFIDELSRKHEQFLFFVEGVPMAARPSWTAEDRVREDGTPLQIVEAFHWYDGLTLLFKKWRPWVHADAETSALSIGRGSVRRSIKAQIARFSGYARGDGIPAFLGEFGVQFDLDGGRSYRTGDYASQEEALGAYYDAIDSTLVSSTIWNYSATNTHESGDGWNTEDLSIFSATTGEARALRGFSRPYAMAVAGQPVRMDFNRKRRTFTFEWEAASGTTEIYVPAHWYPEGWRTEFECRSPSGQAVLEEKGEDQRLFVTVEGIGAGGDESLLARVVIRPA